VNPVQLEYVWATILLGIALAVIASHQQLLNLNFIRSFSIGAFSGIAGSIAYLLLATSPPGNIPLVAEIAGVLVVIASGVVIVLFLFFRDPERHPPSDPNAILSPADGKIIYIRDVRKGIVPCTIKGKKRIPIEEITKNGAFSQTDGAIVGIAMSILDVHVTRIPVDGRVGFLQEFPGTIISPKSWRSEIENPRTTIVIENGRFPLGVVEIGTPLISKILSSIRPGDEVQRGERMGKITWGSQVDMIIPIDAITFSVAEGDYVRAGETVIARIEPEGVSP
jgi:phosphatidylserine decarboxylase